MKELFHKIPVELPDKPSPKERRKLLSRTIRGGSFCPNFSTYQPPPIACNNDLCFPFGLGLLGSSTGIL